MKIVIGTKITLLLTDKGKVYYWSKKDYPKKIKFPKGVKIRSISVGCDHSAAIDVNNNVWIWGKNKYYQLGLGNTIRHNDPVLIDFLIGKVKKISCLTFVTMALTIDGEVYSWGLNSQFSFLGLDSEESYWGMGPANPYYIKPTKIFFPRNAVIKKIYIGEYIRFAVDTNSNIYSWGFNQCGELGNGNHERQYMPVLATTLSGLIINKICFTYSVEYSCTYILSGNKIYYLGDFLRVPEYLRMHFERPVLLSEICFPTEGGIEKIYDNNDGIYYIMDNGDVYSYNYKKNTSAKLIIPDNKYFYFISRCNGTVYAITPDKEIYTWGLNNLVSDKPIMIPTKLTYFDDNCIQIGNMNRVRPANNI